VSTVVSPPEQFTGDERARLAPYFTNLDGHVFALTNLPETVKGALFARYSRSAKSLRRLFLDEFADKVDRGAGEPGSWGAGRSGVGSERAEQLFARVFNEYGDDSVAQLGGAHIACEYVSNVLTKVLEWGRLMAYLEQSTRYVPYTDKLHGRWRYHVPAEIGAGALRDRYVQKMDAATPTRFIAPRSGRKRSTRSAACCPPRRSRTSGSTAPARRSRRCCSACAPTRSWKSGTARPRCWRSCAR
jgi:hypothetical protein